MSDQQERMERLPVRRRSGEPQLLCPAGFPVPAGTKEWVVEKGDKGDKGEQGDRGERGMPTGQRRAVVYLFVLNFALFIVLGVGVVHWVHAYQDSQRQAGRIVERALCADLGTMATLKPPAGNPATNPSRAYEQAEHRAWRGLVADLGCRKETTP